MEQILSVEKTKTYFIACFELQQMKYFNGELARRDGDIGWLGLSDAYPSVVAAKGAAHHFEAPPTPAEAAKWDGMPWWNRAKPGTLRVFEVTEITTPVVRHEREVTG